MAKRKFQSEEKVESLEYSDENFLEVDSDEFMDSDVRYFCINFCSEPEVSEPIERTKKNGDEKFKAPTREEMTQLTETQELFKSNLFKLQMEELLKEIGFTKKQKTVAENCLHQMKSLLDSMKSRNVKISDLEKELANSSVCIPFDVDGSMELQFSRPSSVYIIGSFLLETIIRCSEGFLIDMAVEIPKSVFKDCDFMDFTYFKKRAVYLSLIVQNILNSDFQFDSIKYELLQHDDKRPVIAVKVSNLLTIRIIPMISADTFDLEYLGPLNSSIQNIKGPSPFYNASIIAESMYLSHLSFLHGTMSKCTGFQDSCRLGKLWLKQRGFSELTNFSGFIWSMITAYLLSPFSSTENCKHRLLSSYSSYQLFKLTLDFLSTRDFKKPIFMSEKTSHDHSPETPVFIDPSGSLNFGLFLSFSDIDLVQREAMSTMELLNDFNGDHFESIFLDNMANIDSKFDHILELEFENIGMNSDISDYQRLTTITRPLLLNALKQRVLDLHFACTKKNSWYVNEKSQVSKKIRIYANGNPKSMLDLVEFGPSPTEAIASDEFKRLWGTQKVQVRRFRDGSILNAVVWNCENTFEMKTMILPQMLEYLIKLHSPVPLATINIHSSFKTIQKLLTHPVTGKLETVSAFMDNFQLLKKILKEIDLPLAIESIRSSSDSARYTAVFPMISGADQEADVFIEFEKSGRWPDDLNAIQEMKAAFYLKISEMINDQFQGSIESHIMMENRGIPLGDRFLQINLNGFKFNCRINQGRELHLIENLKVDTQDIKSQYEVHSLILPQYFSRVSNFCVEDPFLSCVIRLVKRWMAAHMIPIPQIATELLCIYAIKIKNKQRTIISSIQNGFTRVLQVLSNLDPINQPIFFDFDEETSLMENAFMVNRSNISNIKHKKAIYIASPFDPECKIWNEGNNIMIANRIRHLASASLGNDLQAAFLPSFAGFDVLIQLNPKICPLSIQENLKKEQNLPKNICFLKNQSRTNQTDYMVLNRFISDLQRTFGSTCIFFFDEYSGNKIGALFKPEFKGEKQFKPLIGMSLMIKKEKIFGNSEAILAEIQEMGAGIVDFILCDNKN